MGGRSVGEGFGFVLRGDFLYKERIALDGLQPVVDVDFCAFEVFPNAVDGGMREIERGSQHVDLILCLSANHYFHVNHFLHVKWSAD